MTISSNEYQKAKTQAAKKDKKATQGLIAVEEANEELKPKDGNKFTKVLAKKKTVRDTAGGADWEVVDKRDAYLVERPIVSDSEDGSELSYD